MPRLTRRLAQQDQRDLHWNRFAEEEQGAATKEIARNVEQASAGAAEVPSNVVGMSEAAADTERSAVRVSGASIKIGDEVGTLRTEVKKFLGDLKAS